MNQPFPHPVVVSKMPSVFRPAFALVTGLATLVATSTLIGATLQPSLAQSEKPSSIPEDTSHLIVPVARVNPNQPIIVTIANDTGILLEYSFSTSEMSPQELQPGDTTTIESAPIPTGLFINALTSAAILDYAIESNPGNTLLVTVSLVDQLYDASGFSAIDIHETGAIYRY